MIESIAIKSGLFDAESLNGEIGNIQQVGSRPIGKQEFSHAYF